MSKKDGKASLIKATEKKYIYSREVHTSEEIKSREIARACPVKIIQVL